MMCGWESLCLTTVYESLSSRLLLCAIWHRFAVRGVLTALLSPLATPWWSVIQRVESLCSYIRVLCPLTAPYPWLRSSLDAIVGPSDGPCHAGYGVRVAPQGQAVRYCPLQAAVVLREALEGLQAVQDAEDGGGDRVECCNAITWKRRMEIALVLHQNWK